MEVTRLLQIVEGDYARADDHAITAIYEEIRRLARSSMRRERGGHTLVPTALANEAFLRLFGGQRTNFSSSADFFAAAATTLRRILVEHERRKSRRKRGGGFVRHDLDPDTVPEDAPDPTILGVDEALQELAEFDAMKARLVELRFFAGMTIEEAAQLLGMSERTAARDWRVARAFLRSRLGSGEGTDDLDG